MGKINDKEKKIYKQEQEKKRQKAKSGRPSTGIYVDPVNTPHSTIRATYSEIPKERWEKIFGSKSKSKDSDKKTR